MREQTKPTRSPRTSRRRAIAVPVVPTRVVPYDFDAAIAMRAGSDDVLQTTVRELPTSQSKASVFARNDHRRAAVNRAFVEAVESEFTLPADKVAVFLHALDLAGYMVTRK